MSQTNLTTEHLTTVMLIAPTCVRVCVCVYLVSCLRLLTLLLFIIAVTTVSHGSIMVHPERMQIRRLNIDKYGKDRMCLLFLSLWYVKSCKANVYFCVTSWKYFKSRYDFRYDRLDHAQQKVRGMTWGSGTHWELSFLLNHCQSQINSEIINRANDRWKDT